MSRLYGIETDISLQKAAAEKLSERLRAAKHEEAEDREEKIAQCLVDALVCGDFLLECKVDGDIITYKPARRVAFLEEKLRSYERLIKPLVDEFQLGEQEE